jgi:uncharacterized protein YndB with AHSA1/START domain
MPATTRGSSEAVSDREVLTTRTLDAPRERVFAAWTRPELLARWWGPKGFTNTFHVFDPKPNGEWRFVMHGPDGVDYKNHSVFAEVLPPERLAFRHVNGPTYEATVTFGEEGEKTAVMWRMRFDNAQVFSKLKPVILEGNLQNLDKLEALLAAEG